MKSPIISVVIPTYNRLHDLRVTMDAIFSQKFPADQIEIVVVDNSSTDGTQAWVESLANTGRENVRYLRKSPEGPAAARNLGIRYARGEFTLFIDSDVVLDENWARIAFALMRADPRLGSIGGQVVYAHSPSRLNAYGGAISPICLAWDHCEGEPISVANTRRECLWLNCSAMMARTAALRELNGFDETFFYGYEDSDLGWRLNLAAYRVAVVPDLVVTHRVDPNIAASDPKIVYHYFKNRLRSLLKNYALPRLCVYGAANVALMLLDSLVRAPHAPKLKALWWNMISLPATFRERKGIQKNRRVSDHDLLPLFEAGWFPPSRLGGKRRRPADASAAAVSLVEIARDDRVH